MNLIIFFILGGVLYADQSVIAKKVTELPVIDGRADDRVWEASEWTVTRDKVANIDISFKTIYTNDKIAFLVKFPDNTKSVKHKTMVWDKIKEKYILSGVREDTFVFKWNINPEKAELTLSSNSSYVADVWFWKANRTDPVGYADDKHQIYDLYNKPKSKSLFSKNGRIFYLSRNGDEGKSAYKQQLYFEYKKDKIPAYQNRTPKGSRADIKAKGFYKDGYWTIEFLRKLDTGHKEDDVIFDTAKNYFFGISRYEIKGITKPNYNLDQPLYANGEIGEMFKLEFK